MQHHLPFLPDGLRECHDVLCGLVLPGGDLPRLYLPSHRLAHLHGLAVVADVRSPFELHHPVFIRVDTDGHDLVVICGLDMEVEPGIEVEVLPSPVCDVTDVAV